jgi:hypothetical protein
VKSGSSYLSQSELPLTFGLGKPEEARTVSLEILWPSGVKDRVTEIHPNQFITVQEGKGIVSAQAIVFVHPAPHSSASPSPKTSQELRP